MKYEEISEKLSSLSLKSKKAIADALAELFPECDCIQQPDPYRVMVYYKGQPLFEVIGTKDWNGVIRYYDTFSYYRRYYHVRDKSGRYLHDECAMRDSEQDMKRARRAIARSEFMMKSPFAIRLGEKGRPVLGENKAVESFKSILGMRRRAKERAEANEIPYSVCSMLQQLAKKADRCSADYDPEGFWKGLENAYGKAIGLLTKSMNENMEKVRSEEERVRSFLEGFKGNW